jgi:hypothetical protein
VAPSQVARKFAETYLACDVPDTGSMGHAQLAEKPGGLGHGLGAARPRDGLVLDPAEQASASAGTASAGTVARPGFEGTGPGFSSSDHFAFWWHLSGYIVSVEKISC